jgi:protein-S-isoprenylcysteine O-methyltransferase Ste14
VSAGAKAIGVAALVVTFLTLEGLVVGYCGLNPRSITGVAIGAVIGLASLVCEMHIVDRALRSAKGDTASATFQTFAMRLAIVAPLTFVFQSKGSSVDPTAFSVAYLVTFFMYLCQLTWTTYHAPVQYRAKPKQFAPRVVVKNVATGSGR